MTPNTTAELTEDCKDACRVCVQGGFKTDFDWAKIICQIALRGCICIPPPPPSTLGSIISTFLFNALLLIVLAFRCLLMLLVILLVVFLLCEAWWKSRKERQRRGFPQNQTAGCIASAASSTAERVTPAVESRLESRPNSYRENPDVDVEFPNSISERRSPSSVRLAIDFCHGSTVTPLPEDYLNNLSELNNFVSPEECPNYQNIERFELSREEQSSNFSTPPPFLHATYEQPEPVTTIKEHTRFSVY